MATICGLVTFLVFFVYCCDHLVSHIYKWFYLQVDGNGNCLFTVIKKALGVWHKDAHGDPFYPTQYFCRQVIMWLVQNCQRVWYNKHAALEANYGLEEETSTFKGPLTYKSYCRHLLDKKFWGDEVVLYAMSAMWNLHITVFNSKTDKEYRVRHSVVMDHADVNTIFNTRTHYSATGRSPGSHKWSSVFFMGSFM